MKKIIFAILALSITSVIFYSCTNENQEKESINSKITTFENKIQLTNRNDYKLTELNNNANNYNTSGTKFYNTIQNVKSIIWKSKDNKKSFEDIKPQIENLLKSESTTKINFNETEKVLLESYLKRFNVQNGIELSIEYENFAIENFKNQKEISNFLIIVAQLKHLSFIIKPLTESTQKTYRQWEACTNACMQDRYEEMNIVDWVGHVASGLVGGVAWNYAGCSYGCL